jgi:ubiquinone/menaquinone biosynthesis C-methylase UbiE
MGRFRPENIYDPKTVKQYYEAVGNKVGENPNQPESDRLFDSLIPKDLTGKETLDHGCGNGRYAEVLERNGARNIVGIDSSEPMIRAAKRLSKGSKEREFVCADMDELPLQDNRFDFILSRFSLVYSSDIQKTVKEMSRVLKNGGEALIETNVADIREHTHEVQEHPVPLRHILGNEEVPIKNMAITMNEYDEALKAANFRIIESRTFPAKEIVIQNDYPYRDCLSFEVLVMRIRKVTPEDENE